MQKQKLQSYSGREKHPVWVGVGMAGIVVGALLTLWHPERVQSLTPPRPSQSETVSHSWWDVQAIDTMKTSRDRSREFLSGSGNISSISDAHAERIASTGATHIAIATPYDEEFLPILEQWVESARKYELNVWYRGNWSGWEQWFEYPSITREQHLEKTVAFLNDNQHLFEDGDIFQACPECENGGPGDPRHNGDEEGHKLFLIDLYQASAKIFEENNVDVDTRLNSMNGDVARLIMDPETTQALGGLVVVDHYVESPEELIEDLNEYAEQSGGQIILGEFGAPIPDIHGDMTHEEQAAWLDELFELMLETPSIVGMNYWTDTGSSTQLWNDAGEPRVAAGVVANYYTPKAISGVILDTNGRQIADAAIRTHQREGVSNQDGSFSVPYTSTTGDVVISKVGFKDAVVPMQELVTGDVEITLEYDLLARSTLTTIIDRAWPRIVRYLLFRF